MTRPVLVLRPEPGASATVAAARALGLEAIAAPLFTVRPCSWALPDNRPDALLLTSANAIRHGGEQLATLVDLPVYAVGAATAEAARNAGFTSIVAGDGNARAAVELAVRNGVTSLLHLAGRDHQKVVRDDVEIICGIVYASDVAQKLPENAKVALPQAVTLLHSPRAAHLFASLIDPTGLAIAAISPAALAAAGPGWRIAEAADRPTDASLLAVAAKLCNQDG